MVIHKNAQISNKNKPVLENKSLTEDHTLLQRVLIYHTEHAHNLFEKPYIKKIDLSE